MPSFRCTVANMAGARKELLREGASRSEVAASFSTGEWFLVSIEDASDAKPKESRVPSSVVGEFTEMTSLLLESGLTLRDALEVEAEFPSGGRFRDLVADLLEDIHKGLSFASAVERRGTSFPPIYRGMIRIGDRIGSVEKVFPRLARYLADRKALRDRLVGAAAYPILVLVFAIVGTMVISFFLLPRIADLFTQLGGAVAGDIEARAAAAGILFRSLAIGIALLAAAAIATARLRRGDGKAAVAIDRAVLKTPYVGELVRSNETLNFALAMEILASGDIPLEAALGESTAVIGNKAYKDAVSAVRDAVMRGEPLSHACSGRKEFPPYVARWIAVGENTGDPGRVFAQIRRYFQNEMEKRSSRILTLIEPVLIILVGCIVLFLVMTFVLPLFSLYESIV